MQILFVFWKALAKLVPKHPTCSWEIRLLNIVGEAPKKGFAQVGARATRARATHGRTAE